MGKIFNLFFSSKGSKVCLMKKIAFILLLTILLASMRIAAPFASETSQCVQCHTNVKKLIRLGWEVEKEKGKPLVSQEIEGEG